MNTQKSSFKTELLIALYCFCIITAELMGAKTFPILEVNGYKLTGAVGMLLIPFIYSINDIFFEVYGHQRTKDLAKISLMVVSALVIFALIAVALPASSRFASSAAAYNTIFSQSIRISIASLIALGASNFLDIAVFARLKKRLNKQGLWFRNNLSNFIALFTDTVLFMTLAFYALDQSFSSNFTFLSGIILPYWLLKFLVSSFGTPLVYWGVNWLKKD